MNEQSPLTKQTMIFRGRHPSTSKTVISNKTIEQINTYNNLGWSLLYEKEKKDIAIKISYFLQITGIISQIVKPSKIQKQNRLLICNTLATPTLLYSSKTWTQKEKGEAGITEAEKEFFRKPAKTKEPESEPVLETTIKLNGYDHVRRMDRSRLLNAIMKYQPEAKRNPGRILKKLLDCYIDTGASHKV
jgi:hypothetical protein